MGDFFIKSKDGKFVPISIKNVFTKDMDKSLMIVKVGSDDKPATSDDFNATVDSFNAAEVLNDISVSVILTPYEVDVGIASEEEIQDKNIFIQITKGRDIGMLEDCVRSLYKKLRGKYNVSVIPSPLKVKDYIKVKGILRRSKIRKERRSRVKG